MIKFQNPNKYLYIGKKYINTFSTSRKLSRARGKIANKIKDSQLNDVVLAANELYHVGEILFVLLTIAIQTKSRKRDKGRTRLLVLVDKFGSAFI